MLSSQKKIKVDMHIICSFTHASKQADPDRESAQDVFTLNVALPLDRR